jgi:hypothetical protein
VIRGFTLADLAALESSATFPVDNLRGKRALISGSVETGGKLQGSFWVHESSELSLILDRKLSQREKLEAIRELTPWLIRMGLNQGITETHVYTPNRDFANVLVQHFGFDYRIGHSLMWKHNGQH